MKTATIYWLIPARAELDLFRRIVRILAKEYRAPLFTPHLTLGVAQGRGRNAKEVLRALSASNVRLRICGVSQSSKFTKTLFVRMAGDAALRKLVRQLDCRSDRIADPHISLLYQDISARTRRGLASVIKLPIRKVTFSSVQAVRCVMPTRTTKEVRAWRVIARKTLRAR